MTRYITMTSFNLFNLMVDSFRLHNLRAMPILIISVERQFTILLSSVSLKNKNEAFIWSTSKSRARYLLVFRILPQHLLSMVILDKKEQDYITYNLSQWSFNLLAIMLYASIINIDEQNNKEKPFVIFVNSYFDQSMI